ncbi:MAG: signal transduction histidine kinase/DNA-binding NarL/FixJ family response regulator [Flavobacteriales bacterium]|jgi:signal transduction histidine kinase/DNA-binding NarL/FixJ family response regulator
MPFDPAKLDVLALEAAPEFLYSTDRGVPDVARLALAKAMTFFGACRGTVTRVRRVEGKLLARVIWSAATGGGPTHEGAEFYEDTFPVTLPRFEKGYTAWWGRASYDDFVELQPLADADLPGGGYIILPAHTHGEFIGFVSFDLPDQQVPFSDALLGAARRWARLVLGAVCRYEAAAKAQDVETRMLRRQRLESLGTMAGGVAHDFNNLLVVMQSFGFYASRSIPKDDPDITKMAQSFDDALRRASQLTSQLLLFAHDSQPVLKGVNLREELPRLVAMARRLIPESSEISMHVAADVMTATVDAVMFDQALLNLIQNAADAMPAGGQIEVLARSRRLEDSEQTVTDISVRDNGTGMSPGDLARAREPFFTTKGEGGGSGLGLAMTQAFVERVGGSLAIESESGVGTKVTITLRTGPAVLDTLERSIDLRGGHETILLVEDNNIVRRVAETVLRRAGYEVLEACDGQEGLALVAEHGDIHLIISDVVMPRLGGYAMVMQIRATYPQMPVLFCSGYDLGEHPQDFVDDPWMDAIRKPFSPAELLGHARGLLDRSETQRSSSRLENSAGPATSNGVAVVARNEDSQVVTCIEDAAWPDSD